MMKTKMALNSKQLGVIENIANGSIVINSIEVMRDICSKFPAEPFLVRIYADLLLKHEMPEQAAQTYNRAAILFCKNGEMLQGIVAKISQWHIETPSDQNIESFLSSLNEYNLKKCPIDNFFSKLSIVELKAFCFLFETIRRPAGTSIKEFGDIEDNLFLVVSGKLRDSIYLTLQNQGKVFRQPILILSKNDFFGEIYPFNEKQQSKSYIETLEPTELVSISKEKLIRICHQYPHIELAILDLLKIRALSATNESPARLRRAQRYELKAKLNLEIFPKASNGKTILVEGASKDISVGGMGIILDLNSIKDSFDISSLNSSLNNAKIRVDISKDGCALSFSGTIAWSREIVHEGVKTIAIGMEFIKMSPRMKGFFYTLINSLG